MKKEQGISAGLNYMQAVVSAMPKTMGDRERIAAIGEAMLFAIRNRFGFDRTDAEALNRLNQRTCVGVFRAMDYYTAACAAGGTYARMWEAAHGRKPWMALKVIVPRWRQGYHPHTTILDDNRVAEGLGVLLPPSFEESDDALLHKGYQVWWVTSQDDDFITVCRYRAGDEADLNFNQHAFEREFRREGAPVRRRKLTRDQWKELNSSPVEEKLAA
ncbi:hypothetical protein [Paraburkholderia sp. A3RO-2L]|jgi:hypothetical protein|uniref:hypothetical protein n=1 Tax=unclassified Paraburkholderia TaxID=2615204 RepID=UPI003DA9DB29